MENQEKNQKKEEINNPEQFSVGRSNALHQHADEEDQPAKEVEYAEEEMEFADGKGTELAEAFPEETEEDEAHDDGTEEKA